MVDRLVAVAPLIAARCDGSGKTRPGNDGGEGYYGTAMARIVIGIFPDSVAAQKAHTELAAAGFIRAHTAAAGLLVLVEAAGRETEARSILLRAGAERLEEHVGGSGGAVQSLRAGVRSVGPATRRQGPDEERHPHGGDWLREVVFGLNDGLVTTLVFIIAAGALAQTHATLLRIVLAEVAAGGVAMALGGYLAARTARDVRDYRIAVERREIATEPEEERAELREIYRLKGLRDGLLDRVVAHLTATDERWLRTLVHDELGVVVDVESAPQRQGLQIGASFVLGGLIPLVAVLLGLEGPWMQIVAYALAAVSAVGLGALKARHSLIGPLRNGLAFLAIVTAGTLAGVVIGVVLHAA